MAPLVCISAILDSIQGLLTGMICTRVSNSLRSRSPQAVRVSVSAEMDLAASESIMVSSILFARTMF
ncbi:hypothetical protein TanjilG_15826 [Lupinus angustifolius]|uniref:Uncharacterized protein n=1 Tax=Lupinus angustifolius TaxID=3871 RepID=A0A1J7I2Q1_LUPAN|nr:hypothetical protein TanjilG_15826 [Lupinus angustifolius]